LASFERAASLAPYLSGHWRNVAQARIILVPSDPSMLARASEAGLRAVAAQPVDPVAHEIYAEVLFAQGDRDGAIREARRAIELSVSTPGAHDVLAIALAQTGDLAAAERVALDGLPYEDPASLTLDHLLAQIYVRQGNIAEAEKYIPPPRADALKACGDRC